MDAKRHCPKWKCYYAGFYLSNSKLSTVTTLEYGNEFDSYGIINVFIHISVLYVFMLAKLAKLAKLTKLFIR